jgi:hypothetical protein
MRGRTAILLAGGVGYSLIAASTTPFTLPADVLTGAAIVGMAVVVCLRWPLRTKKVRAASLVGGPAAGSAKAARSGHPYLPWLGLLLVFVAWELFNYLVHGTRADHPTISSITDAIDRTYLLKTLMFLGWLAGGLVIIRRGSRSRAWKAGMIGPAER